MIDIEIDRDDGHSDTDTDIDRSCSPVLPDHRFFFRHLGVVPEPAHETAKAEPIGVCRLPSGRTIVCTGTASSLDSR